MQSVPSRIWTRVIVSISYDDNHYTTGTSKNASNKAQDLEDCKSVEYAFIAIILTSTLIRPCSKSMGLYPWVN